MTEIKALRSADGGSAVLVECLIAPDAAADPAARPERHTYTILAEQYRQLRLKRGPLTEEEAEALETASELCGAVRKGRQLLSYGPCSALTLRQKLRARGFPAVIAAEAVDVILSDGIIDEEGDAVREAEKRVAHGDARAAILSRLHAHGYCADAVDAAVRYLNTVDFTAVCAEAMKKKCRSLPDDEGERKKMIASLLRAGFTGQEVREAAVRLTTIREEEENKWK